STRLNSSHVEISYAVFCLKKNQKCALDRKSTRLNSSHVEISYDVFCLKKKNFFLLSFPSTRLGPNRWRWSVSAPAMPSPGERRPPAPCFISVPGSPPHSAIPVPGNPPT